MTTPNTPGSLAGQCDHGCTTKMRPLVWAIVCGGCEHVLEEGGPGREHIATLEARLEALGEVVDMGERCPNLWRCSAPMAHRLSPEERDADLAAHFRVKGYVWHEPVTRPATAAEQEAGE